MNFLSLPLLLFISAPEVPKAVQIIKLDALDEVTAKGDSPIKIINFWASWCGPCVKEMPYLEALNKSGKAEVIFVCLDFIKDLPKVNSLIEKKGIDSKVYLLDETDYDKLIPTVDPSWSGAIPATILVDARGKRHFYEKSFSEQELNDLIKIYTPK